MQYRSKVVHLLGKQLYVVYPAGIGRSKLTGALIEQKFGSRGTARNWNTVLKLAAVSQEMGVTPSSDVGAGASSPKRGSSKRRPKR